ncbi:MAG: hypothetical protein A3C36_06330 [Omnitrophica WOR_2 bacterium RIFCSPHIGHO2_02_FULL_52_10]|nr:MAG: hypothetical protein A3C36_06330 [Omnitrophica WOR_2 bacterium RIFCSPHIGHO2_02_FULL_52_10]
MRAVRGLTLTELLVASALVGIVMLGIVSFGLAIRQMQGSTSKTVILSMRAKAAMAQVTNDAILSAGDPTNMGVRADTTGDDRSISFRKGIGDPSSYNDDKWARYYKDGTDKLYRCEECNDPPTNACQVPVSSLGNCGNNRRYLIDINDSTFGDFFTIQNDANGRLDYIELILNGIYDRTKAIHPIENPEITVTTRVSPPGHSR